jgi:dihydrodipicolinate synthase/N-acetylneuraminate lyase
VLSAADVTGLLALPPSALKADGEHWDEENTVDLDEATRLADQMIKDGAGAIGLCGTTGECATLLWDEKVALYGAVIDAVAGRVPVWCGTTALGTREVVRQMRAAQDLGAAAAFVGLPLWQTPTMENAIGFFADLGEAVPDLPIMVYANRFFFKFDFPVEFWEGIVAKAPTVIATKVGFPLTQEHLDAARHQVNFMTGEGTIGMHYRLAPETVTAAWATARPPSGGLPTSKGCRCRSRTSATSTSTTSSSRRRASTPRATRTAARPARPTATYRRRGAKWP